MSYNYSITEGIAEMFELPDGTHLEIDCREPGEVLVTHWVEGDPIQSMQVELTTED